MPTSVALVALLRRQDGVATRAQLIELGVHPSSMAWRLQRLRWTPMLPGVYLLSGGTPTERQRAWAAVLYGGIDAQLTGIYAMRQLGVRIPAADPPMVLIPHSRRMRQTPGVVVRRTHHSPRPVHRGELACAPVPRATLDACLGVDDLMTVRARLAASVQQGRCSPEQLVAAAAEIIRPIGLLRVGLEEIVAGIRSAPEGLARTLILGSSLPVPLWNPRIYTMSGEFVAEPDGYWEEAGVALEMESKAYHFYEHHWVRTLGRRSLMAAHGILVVQCPPSRLTAGRQGVLKELALAIDTGLARPRLPLVVRPVRCAIL